jgi:catalase
MGRSFMLRRSIWWRRGFWLAAGDYYTQPGSLFRLMTPDAQQRLFGNIAGGLGQVETRIQDLQINHFYKCDPKYGEGVAKALGAQDRRHCEG